MVVVRGPEGSEARLPLLLHRSRSLEGEGHVVVAAAWVGKMIVSRVVDCATCWKREPGLVGLYIEGKKGRR